MPKEFIDWRTLMPDKNMHVLFSEKFDSIMDYLDKKIPLPYKPVSENESQAMFNKRLDFAKSVGILSDEDYNMVMEEVSKSFQIISKVGILTDELIEGECSNLECPIHGKRSRKEKQIVDKLLDF